MTRPITFPRFRRNFWSDLDGNNDIDNLGEGKEEADVFNEEVRREVEWKQLGQLVPPAGPPKSAEQTVEAVAQQPDSTTFVHEGNITSAVAAEEEFDDPLPSRPPSSPPKAVDTSIPANVSFIPPSFYTSHFLQTSTPRARSSTYPSVPTPSDNGTPRLPPPAPVNQALSARPRSSRIPDTPEYIASPIDSPSTSVHRPHLNSNSIGEGRGRRDDPATPVQIGKSALSDIKSKRDHQAISKHFDQLTKVLVKNKDPQQGKGKGRQPVGKALSVASGLGGKVFDRLRFCLTSEVNQAAKLKQRADIIANLGGQVVLQPDTAITHVIYDAGKSASLLAAKLGLDSLSELPEGTVCVKWDWVVQCKMAGRTLDPTPWLSFPKTSFSRAVSANAIRPTSRIFDITDQLRGKSVAITRKREPTASDSDTEESLKKRTRLVQTKSITLFPPVSELSENNAVAGSSRVQQMANMDITVATEHSLPTGPGWDKASRTDRDALDDMIAGVVEGSLEDPEVSDEEGEERIDQGENANSTSVSSTNGYTCNRKNDGKGYTGPNEWLAKKFEELHDLYQGQVGKNSFAIRGYQRAAGIMRRIDYPITTGAQARAIPGIGQSLADRIDEFLSGAQGRAFYENTEQARCIALFKDIYGVGRQNANDLYRLGARTIDDLRSGRFALTAGQMIGLQLYEDLKARIPRNECKDIFEIIRSEAQAIDDQLWVEIMGSYRRGQETSGDVDILITRNGGEDGKKGVLGELVQRLKRRGLITHDLGTPSDWNAPEAKWMGVGRLGTVHKHRRIDILCIPFEHWGAALLYFTEPYTNLDDQFNRSMRLYARKTGFSLNQRGLYKGVLRGKDGLKQTEGELVASRTEQDIFNALGLRWR
uniref:DNA polymerase lambda n=1 Tax=Kwoniella bestiolae CBS 10118 TaxID=1296100 RepID=A0A1B9FVZ7_9TREE|nr:hypothetical protein I302_07280 [Kwoniella bestiolae CBS 10118]OCF22930.1 hypothetical protein I302_07280 [Kwoniella bestiolae CBS 10118]